MRNAIAAVTSAGILGLAMPAQATITIYTTQSAFNGATTGVATDTFDDISNGNVTNSPIDRTAGAYSYSASAPNDFFGVGSGSDNWLSTNRATDTITFYGFTGNVSALGGLFFGTDIDGRYIQGDITLSITDSDGTTTQTITGATTSSFRGFVSNNTITQLTVSTGLTGDFAWPTVNNLQLGKAAGGQTGGAVPEPATWATMLLGFAVIGGAARHRRRALLAA